MKLINDIINYEQSSYFILTNLNISNEEIKQIYKKRWGVETCFRHSKDKLKINNINSKNINIVKHHVCAKQFILILELFLEKSIKIEKEYILNKINMLKILDTHLLV